MKWFDVHRAFQAASKGFVVKALKTFHPVVARFADAQRAGLFAARCQSIQTNSVPALW